MGDAAKSATISSYVALAANQPVTAVSSNANVSVTASATPNGSGIATFSIVGASVGTSVLTFSVAGRPDLTPLTVNATVTTGDLFLGQADLTRLSGVSLGQSKTVQLGSNGLASTPSGVRVNAQVVGVVQGETPAITVDRSGASNNSFVVTGAAVGTASVQFSATGFTPVTVEVTVTKAELASTESAYDLYTTQSVSFDVSPDEFPVGSDATLLATVDGSDDPSVQVDIEGSRVTLTGLKAGSATVTIADQAANYVPVTFDVTVSTPALASDDTNYEMFYGQSAMVSISSDELALGSQDTVSAAASEDSADVVEIGDAEFVPGSGFEFPITGMKAGSTVVTFTRDGFDPVTVTISVEKPALSADLDLSSIFVGDKATVVLSSDEQPISEDDMAMLTPTASDGGVLSVGDAVIGEDGHTAAFEIEGLKAGSGSVTFSLDNYDEATVQLAVSVPALKADSASLKAVVGVPLSIDISSDDKPLEDAVVTATTTSGMVIGDCSATTASGDGVAAGAVSTVSVCAKA
jgi:hypothetical protein